jgi:hypothetical protein
MSTVGELRKTYRDDLKPRERSAMWSWLGFTVTFGAVRAITYSIKRGKGPFRNISLGTKHVHHYMWGIGMVSAVGAVGLQGDDNARHQPLLAVTYGSGLALIVDEFALLLDLQDVYWAKEGRISVDLGIGVVATGGTAISAVPLITRLARRLSRRRQHRLAR